MADDVDKIEDKAQLLDRPKDDGIDAFEVLRRKDPGRVKLVARNWAEAWLSIPGWQKVGEEGSNVRIVWEGVGEPLRPSSSRPSRPFTLVDAAKRRDAEAVLRQMRNRGRKW